MTKLRDPSEFSIDEIASIGLEAGKEAREKALDAGFEVRSTDNEGRKVLDKKRSDGSIERVIQQESQPNDRQA